MTRKKTPPPEYAQAFIYRTATGMQALRIHGYASRGDVVEVVQVASKKSRVRVPVGWATVGELLSRAEYARSIVTTAYFDGEISKANPENDGWVTEP